MVESVEWEISDSSVRAWDENRSLVTSARRPDLDLLCMHVE